MHVRRYMTALIALTCAVAVTPSRAITSAGGEPARLLEVSSEGRGVAQRVLIRASAPVAYAPIQLDPLTVLVDVRNVRVDDLVNQLHEPAPGPIAGVTVEAFESDGGEPTARVRIRLADPMTSSVQSARETIQVDLAPVVVADTVESSMAAPDPSTLSFPAGHADEGQAETVVEAEEQSGPAYASIEAVRATDELEGTVVTLEGSGPLVPSFVGKAEEWPPRLTLDFSDVESGVESEWLIQRGPVKRLRVDPTGEAPPSTRVIFDLVRPVTFHLRPSEDQHQLHVVFERRLDVIPSVPTLLGRSETNGDAAVSTVGETSTAPGAEARLGLPGQPVASSGVLAPEAAGSPDVVSSPVVADAVDAPTDGLRSASSVGDSAPAVGVQAEPVLSLASGTAAGQGAAGAQTSPPPFTGQAVSLDFQNADLRAVLRTFAEISGLNIVIDPAVDGSVDVSLRDVPWDQALDIILRANKLGYSVDGTIVRITPLTVLADEEAQRRRLAEEQALAGELVVMTRTLSYALAADMAPLLTRAALSPRGTVQVDERTNTLIITDLEERLTTATDLIVTLDRPEPQVEIEARIVQTTSDFARNLGVQWGLNGRVAPELGNTTGAAFPNGGTLSGRTGGAQGPGNARTSEFEQIDTAVNLPASNATSAIGVALSAINGAFNLDVALSALEREGKGRVLSTPRVSTQNNVEAEVTQGIQIPIQTVANNTVTVTFKDAALTLRVTPQITSANTVIMRIGLENATPDFGRSVNGIPPINTQRANTQVLVNDGATTVIGGIFVSSEQAVMDRTPFFHRIPLLGWLFKRSEIADESRELLIFITPRIIKG